MSGIATDIEHFNAQLDANPLDYETMAVLADAYEEAGDDRMAAAYRWCAEKRFEPNMQNTSGTPWMLGRLTDPRDWRLGDYGLGRFVSARFETRLAAMEALADALEQGSER